MRAALKGVAGLAPLLAALAACTYGYNANPASEAATLPPTSPPITVAGALGAPADATAAPSVGSTVAPAAGAAVMPPVTAVAGPTRLGGPEVMRMLTNNTATGLTAGGTPYAIYFAADGGERFREASVVDQGSWRVLPNGQLCTRLVRIGADAERCYWLSRYGGVTLFQHSDGTPAGSFRVLSGNPQNL